MIRVLFVDDHRLVRAGLIGLLSTAPRPRGGRRGRRRRAGRRGRAATSPGRRPDGPVDARDRRRRRDPAAARRLPGHRVVALTSFSDRQRVNDALGAGAIGYLLKDCAPEELLAGGTRRRRRARAARPARRRRPAAGPAGDRPRQLSDREQQVLRLAARGLANKQIGRRLGITERTVKVHLGNVFRRIGVTDRTSAALWARDNLDGAGRSNGRRGPGSVPRSVRCG